MLNLNEWEDDIWEDVWCPHATQPRDGGGADPTRKDPDPAARVDDAAEWAIEEEEEEEEVGLSEEWCRTRESQTGLQLQKLQAHVG